MFYNFNEKIKIKIKIFTDVTIIPCQGINWKFTSNAKFF